LQVGPDRAVVDHERQLDVREVLDQPVDDGNGRVLPVAHTEDDLEGGILLPAKAGQVFVELSVIAAQRLQDRHRWRTRGDAAPRSAVAGRAPEGDDPVGRREEDWTEKDEIHAGHLSDPCRRSSSGLASRPPTRAGRWAGPEETRPV